MAMSAILTVSPLTTVINAPVYAELTITNSDLVNAVAINSITPLVFSTPAGGSPPTTPNLGTAASYAVLASSTITDSSIGGSTLTGNLGLSPGSSVTGFPPSTVSGTTDIDNARAVQAQADATAAYNYLRLLPGGIDKSGIDLGGKTLTPGIYKFSSSAAITGTLTLDAQGNSGAVWIFQIGSTLTTASSAVVTVINGGNPGNIYWQVGSSATLGTSTTFLGTIIAQASITVNATESVTGNLMALTGAVTLNGDVVTVSPAVSSGASLPVPMTVSWAVSEVVLGPNVPNLINANSSMTFAFQAKFFGPSDPTYSIYANIISSDGSSFAAPPFPVTINQLPIETSGNG